MNGMQIDCLCAYVLPDFIWFFFSEYKIDE